MAARVRPLGARGPLQQGVSLVKISAQEAEYILARVSCRHDRLDRLAARRAHFPGAIRAAGPSLLRDLLARARRASLAVGAMRHMTRYSIKELFRDIASYHHTHYVVQISDSGSDNCFDGSDCRSMESQIAPQAVAILVWDLKFLRESAQRISADCSARAGRLLLRHTAPSSGAAWCGVRCANPAPLRDSKNGCIVASMLNLAASSGSATQNLFGDDVLSVGNGLCALASARHSCLRARGALKRTYVQLICEMGEFWLDYGQMADVGPMFPQAST